MILIAGGTGRLGSELVKRFTERGLDVRILTRDPSRADALRREGIEIVPGNVRDPEAVRRSVAGVTTVVSAVHGFIGKGDDSPKTIDYEGNRNLIAAARTAGVEHFVLMSVHGAAADHPMELHRMKYLAEVELKKSGLSWTIIRPTAYMETWLDLIGAPLIESGKTRVFGRGTNPINFVSVRDVAAVVERAVLDPSLRGVEIDLGGPENLSMREVAESVQTVSGRTGSVSAVPLPMMRLMGAVMGPVNRTMARQIRAGVVMDTHDMSFVQSPSVPGSVLGSVPIPSTHLEDVIRRDYAS